MPAHHPTAATASSDPTSINSSFRFDGSLHLRGFSLKFTIVATFLCLFYSYFYCFGAPRVLQATTLGRAVQKNDASGGWSMRRGDGGTQQRRRSVGWAASTRKCFQLRFQRFWGGQVDLPLLAYYKIVWFALLVQMSQKVQGIQFILNLLQGIQNTNRYHHHDPIAWMGPGNPSSSTCQTTSTESADFMRSFYSRSGFGARGYQIMEEQCLTK
jgi:hypothetical protein